MKETNIMEIETADENSFAEVVLPGKLSSIARNIVNQDNENQNGEFDILEQRERLKPKLLEAITGHPEFESWAVEKLLGSAQGSSAKSGLSLLLEAFDNAATKRQFVLIVERGLTLKLTARRHKLFSTATAEDIFSIYQRIKETAEEGEKTASKVLSGLAVLSAEMKRANVATIGELTDSFGKIAFPI